MLLLVYHATKKMKNEKYEKFKTLFKYFDINVCEVIFCLNILCEANLSDEDLRIWTKVIMTATGLEPRTT